MTREQERAVLECPMPRPNDADADTVGDYLVRLLEIVWIEYDGFSGKRPFGNSGWKYDVYGALIDAGLIEGSRDEDGYIDECDARAGDQLVRLAIRELS